MSAEEPEGLPGGDQVAKVGTRCAGAWPPHSEAQQGHVPRPDARERTAPPPRRGQALGTVGGDPIGQSVRLLYRAFPTPPTTLGHSSQFHSTL